MKRACNRRYFWVARGKWYYCILRKGHSSGCDFRELEKVKQALKR